MIQKTGFGKSLCYQFPATQFDGLTIVFSPLIALMRDQVKNLCKHNIEAAYINSEQEPEENAIVLHKAKRGELKILYIAPERQENVDWMEAVQHLNLSMIVIDEAHTISTWGHDFRPSFRRIINLVQRLPEGMPILATTATATKRVQEDIEKQIGGKLTTIRGSLVRENFQIYVIKVKSEEEKMMWLGENINSLSGPGLIYTGTRSDTEYYSRWFQFLGIDAIEYNAGIEGESRREIEKGLMNNQWKCIVSTNALGMGIDKPDIRFVIHTQIPQSPIHYYQEIGRAGRDGKPCTIILFYNGTFYPNTNIPTDYRLPKSFIDGGRPKTELYYRVINLLKGEPLGERQIIKLANLKQTQVRTIIADLKDQNIIKEVMYGKNKKYEYQFNAPDLDVKSFEDLRSKKIEELDQMIEYVHTTIPRMKFLCNFLDSNEEVEYKNCDNTNLTTIQFHPSEATKKKLDDFVESYFPVLEVESKKSNIKNGYAAAYYGRTLVGSTIHRCKYENGGDFPDSLLTLVLKVYKKISSSNFDLVLFVPPTKSGKLVENFARKFASEIRIPISDALYKSRDTKEQKVFQNGFNKRENIKGAFDIDENMVKDKNILLIDDIFDSGATLKEVGSLLTHKGAKLIVPLVIAKTIGGTE